MRNLLPVLWYYLRGYVMIRITGFSMERFMNLAAYRRILFWDARGTGGAGMEMKTSLAGLRELEECAEKTGCQLEILALGGLPAKLRHAKTHPIFAGGILFFAAALYVLSSFVWVVRVEGNERLTAEEILTACEGYGLKPGTWKKQVDADGVTKALLADIQDLSWVSVSIKGAEATVKVAETIVAPTPMAEETPCDIIAEKDGVVEKITTARGTPMVQAGDVVQAGEVLISAQVQVGLEGEPIRTEYVAASGSVQATTWAEVTEEQMLTETEQVFDGKEAENHVLLFGDLELDFIKPRMEGAFETEVLEEKNMGLGDWMLPFSLRREVYRPYETAEKTYTVEEAKALLAEICRQKAAEGLAEGEQVQQTEIRYEVYTDRVRAVCTATLSEEIGKKQVRKELDAEDESNGENHSAGE